MGRIVDIIVDRTGHVRAAVVDFGGFLGVGSRRIAIAWNALRFPANGNKVERVTLEWTRDQVREAPEYRDDMPVGMLEASSKLKSLPRFHKIIARGACSDRQSHHGAAVGRSGSQTPATSAGRDLRRLRWTCQETTNRVPPRSPSRRSLRGLDWFVLFVANVQTGFGPFISVYLTTQKWTQVDIGLVLTVGSLAALVGQIPGGMVVDAARSERLLSATPLRSSR